MKQIIELPESSVDPKKWKDKIFGLLAVVFVASISLVYSNPVDPKAEYSLENSTTRLTIRDNRIVSLYDKIRSIEHVSPLAASSPGLFNVQLVNGIQLYANIDATQTTSSLVSSDAGKLVLSYNHTQVTVKVEASLSASPGEIVWSISVLPTNTTIKVGSVGCPVFDTPASDKGSIKNVVLPFYEGRIHPLNVSFVPWSAKVYPGMLFAQMVGCIGTQGGFLLWTDDSIANVKEFKYTASSTNSRFSVIHRMPYVPGEWKSRYNARISFSGPEWYDVADIYRKWAAGQHWCAKKFKDRTEIPQYVHNPAYTLSLQIGKMSDAELLALPTQLTDLSTLLKAPLIMRGRFWEKRGGWVGIDYFPPKLGDETMKALASDLKSRNIPFMCELTGYTWQNGKSTNITSNINKMTQAELDDLKLYFKENNGQALCEKNAAGELSDQIIRLCRGSSFGQSFIQDNVKKLFDLGITAYHHDSDPGMMPDGIEGCFDASHGHPIPCGPWSTEITKKAFLDVRAEAANRGITNFFLTKEHCAEQLNMVLLGYSARGPQTYTEPFVIPLVNYIYHEYVPIVMFVGSTDELNDVILLGQIPGGGNVKVIPTVISDYYGSMKVFSKDFLLYGQMLRPIISGIPVDVTKLEYSGKEVIVPVPHVHQSAWVDDSGNIGVFVINAKTSFKIVEVPVPEGVNQATFYLGQTKQSVQSVVPGQKLTWNVSPGRLQAIVFKSSTSAAKSIKRTVSMDLFPNPATDMLHLISPQSGDIQSVKIYSSTGNLVKQMNLMDSVGVISVKQLPKGIYVIEVVFKNQMVLQKKFVKN